jgi:hypothetical protein
MICYAAYPNRYLNDYASDIAHRGYGGLFFSIGSWDTGVTNILGVDGAEPKDTQWKILVRENLTALKKAGVTENLLTVSFDSNHEYPSPETVLSKSYTEKMSNHFAVIGKAAKELGFRGVCIDTEYPYPRYELDHEIYGYQDYTTDDLMEASKTKGHATMTAILVSFPKAVILQLPGNIRVRPLERQYILGMLETMAERNAPGGFHIGAEYTYCMHDPVTNLATTRFETASVPLLVNKKTAAYWREKCTIAPGTWPLHMIETSSSEYLMRPWKKEVADLRHQMSILRLTAKRYVWSYSSNRLWYIYSREIGKKYGLSPHDFKRDDINIQDWYEILQDKPVSKDPAIIDLAKKITAFDRGELTGEQLCDAFGTPARWWILGILSNPHTQPEYAARKALLQPVNTHSTYIGRDAVVRCFTFDNYDPRGLTILNYVFDWQHTGSASAHLISFIHSDNKHNGYLHVGWDDGIIIYLGNNAVFDERYYPKRGKGLLFQDRYQFEKRVPITIKKDRTRLSVNSINSHGRWLFSLRITDENGMPFKDVRFRLK